ncbi:endoplasmin [Tanacetum coccineum]
MRSHVLEALQKAKVDVEGLVDSDTVPLNASQEMLQQHNNLKTIKKKLIRKALDMIHKLAEEDPDEVHDKEKKGTHAVSQTYRSKNHRTMMRREVNILRSGMGLANQLSSANKAVDVEVSVDEDDSKNEKEKRIS